MDKLRINIAVIEPSDIIYEDLSNFIMKTGRHLQMLIGLSNKEVANHLNISIHTVINHRKNIMEKTGIRSLPGLTIYAFSPKIAPLDTSPV
ncbi:MAG TPA: LuxR family transcriptional regulator [Bacteroidales bacterium]|nr:LuxR family transcriptional regulator [Bacteroidales bacterium]